jgi:hypothetical protein
MAISDLQNSGFWKGSTLYLIKSILDNDFQKNDRILSSKFESFIQLPRTIYFTLYYLHEISRDRPQKYKMKRESKAAKKAHTQLYIILLIVLMETGMKE